MASLKNPLTEMLGIDFPMLMAPMFLVSNEEMMQEGMKAGIGAAFPTLNFRKAGELENVLDKLNAVKSQCTTGNYGVNLIVQRTNPYYEKHLEVCLSKKVPFYITSLGNPKTVIEKAGSYGAKVFCDVTNLEHAQKCAGLGCDGFIAVGQGAGGHAGPFPLQVLVPALTKHFPGKIVIAAGGIATGGGILSVLALGAHGVSVGTRFIASKEAGVNTAYKKAIVDAGMSDIVMTEKLSGTPCTIINTPEAMRMGLRQNWFERMLSNNPRTKKWFKGLVQLRGFKRLEQSIVPNNYKTLWCAGQSVELIDEVLPCGEIIARLKSETLNSSKELLKLFSPE
jgi:nitronate monooxygenase